MGPTQRDCGPHQERKSHQPGPSEHAHEQGRRGKAGSAPREGALTGHQLGCHSDLKLSTSRTVRKTLPPLWPDLRGSKRDSRATFSGTEQGPALFGLLPRPGRHPEPTLSTPLLGRLSSGSARGPQSLTQLPSTGHSPQYPTGQDTALLHPHVLRHRRPGKTGPLGETPTELCPGTPRSLPSSRGWSLLHQVV